MWKRLVGQPDRRVIVAIIVLLVILSLGAGWLVYRHGIAPSDATSATSHIAPTLPVPDAARSTFTNPVFGYSIHYPTQWTPVVSADKSRLQVFIVHEKSVPQGVGFDVDCAENPSGLSAQQWRQSQVPLDSGETDVGYVELAGGTQAWKAIGHANGTYDVYTTVHGGNVCVIGEYEQNNGNTSIIESSIKTFTWN